jgi:hypothetical protein
MSLLSELAIGTRRDRGVTLAPREIGSTLAGPPVEQRRMLSWVFRHRHRLRLVYGSAPAPALPNAAVSAERDADRAVRAARRHAPGSGSIERHGEFLVIGPMPRRAR